MSETIVAEAADSLIVQVVEVQVGPSGTVTVEGVQTLAPGSQATVDNVGTPSAARLVFGLPAGDKGDPGDAASADAIRAIAADQDTVQIFDFDALVATNLGA